MKGLLIKDILLMKNQKQFFILILIIALGIAIFAFDETFLISYITFIFSLFTISTISYDEYDNGYAYLFSLPITKKLYIKEKYVFALLNIITSLFFSTLLASGIALCKHGTIANELWITPLSIFLIITIMISIMMPLQIKFGAEKGRIASMISFILIFGIFYMLFVTPAIHDLIIEIFSYLPNMNIFQIIGGIAIITIIIIFISYQCSIKAILKKEF